MRPRRCVKLRLQPGLHPTGDTLAGFEEGNGEWRAERARDGNGMKGRGERT